MARYMASGVELSFVLIAQREMISPWIFLTNTVNAGGVMNVGSMRSY